jgi:hypothetical protein
MGPKGPLGISSRLNTEGVSNLTQNFNKFFKIEKQKALGNTNKAVKDLNSTPSFNFVLNSMGNFKRLGNFED